MVGRETAVSNGAMGISCSHPPRLTCLQLDLAASQSIELRMPLGCLFPALFCPARAGWIGGMRIYIMNDARRAARCSCTVLYGRGCSCHSVPRGAKAGGCTYQDVASHHHSHRVVRKRRLPSSPRFLAQSVTTAVTARGTASGCSRTDSLEAVKHLRRLTLSTHQLSREIPHSSRSDRETLPCLKQSPGCFVKYWLSRLMATTASPYC
jgi:hypothetical protein